MINEGQNFLRPYSLIRRKIGIEVPFNTMNKIDVGAIKIVIDLCH